LKSKKLFLCSPLPSLWSEELHNMSELFNLKQIYLGNLIKSELESNSDLGKQIKVEIDVGKIIGDDCFDELLIEKFFKVEKMKFYSTFPQVSQKFILCMII
jgi:adenylate kinase family enzyme